MSTLHFDMSNGVMFITRKELEGPKKLKDFF